MLPKDKKYTNEHPKNKNSNQDSNVKVATRRYNVGNLSIRTLRKHLDNAELPGINSKDYGEEELKDMFIRLDDVLFFDGRSD